MIERWRAISRMFAFRVAVTMVTVMGLTVFITTGLNDSVVDALRYIGAVILGAFSMWAPFYWSRSNDVPKD